MKSTPTLLTLCLLFLLCGCGVSPSSLLSLTGVRLPKSSVTTAKATVLKVYSATDGGHKFIAYVVDRGGVEVIVTDTLAKTSYKVGDTIEYVEQKIEFDPTTSTLSFNILK